MSTAKNNFELAISDAQEILNCYEQIHQSRLEGNSPAPPEVLKRATLVMILTAWETYVEDIASELFNAKYTVIKGSQLGNYLERTFNERLKRFHNPDSVKTKQLFEEFFDVDVTEHWIWDHFLTADEARCSLNQWVSRRGEAVHRAQPDKQKEHLVRKDELEKCIRFFNGLVKVTDRRLMEL